MIDRIGIMRREDKRRYPLSSQLWLIFTLLGKDAFSTPFARNAKVTPVEIPVETGRINIFGFVGSMA